MTPQIVLEALERLQRMGPNLTLLQILSNAAQEYGQPLGSGAESEFWTTVTDIDPNAPLRLSFGHCLRKLYAAAKSSNLEGEPYSEERRTGLLESLNVPSDFRAKILEQNPAYGSHIRPVVIASSNTTWYTIDRQHPDYHWRAYSRQLFERRHWKQEAVDLLGDAATVIVGRLSDPCRRETYSTRGLVVGHVQSGKTANFTAVIAKAADAGYRLVIVLAGTLDVLRNQTQRRLDKELIGREAIRQSADGDEYDYFGDTDWEEFVSHPDSAREQPGFYPWERFTGAQEDYKELKKGFSALRLVREVPGRPLNDWLSLRSAPAKMIVMKKNPKVLGRLARDLSKFSGELAEIPALVIDDESDQASVNTLGAAARAPTNKAILKILSLLPRSQYIGYTATPFANVLIDPDHAEDLFPRDFIIALRRPDGYMGVRDFFDLADDLSDLQPSEVPPGMLSRERAFTRIVSGNLSDPDNLPKAIGLYLLAGAVKLFRLDAGVRVAAPRHHTMLVHISTRVADHDQQRADVMAIYQTMIKDRGRLLETLQKHFVDDIRAVMDAHAQGAPIPSSFDMLVPFIEEAIRRINNSTPVRVVNSDPVYADSLPDFDRESIWAILVGGSKLSRGYTVEGLTVSYYLRTLRLADSLMQVGRWFGFRDGYQDLVRLFVPLALRDSFKSICRDEEVFRQELRRYVDPRFDPPVTPKDIPPLVPSHGLLPTARNKMQAAKVIFQNMASQWKEHVIPSVRDDDRLAAVKGFRAMVGPAGDPMKTVELGTAGVRWTGLAKCIPKIKVCQWLKGLSWAGGAPSLERELQYLTGEGEWDPAVDSVLVILPQLKGQSAWWEPQPGLRSSVHGRSMNGDRSGFKVFSELEHRKVAEWLALGKLPLDATSGTRALAESRTAVLLAYGVEDASGVRTKALMKDKKLTIGFGIKYPPNRISSLLRYGPR